MLLTPADSDRASAKRIGWLGPAALSVGLLAVHSVLVDIDVSGGVTMFANLSMVGIALWWAIRHRFDGDDLGLDRKQARGSFLMGAALAVVVVAGVAMAALRGTLPSDTAVTSLTASAMAVRLLIAIPIGTAVCEELLFRGVLLAAWDRATTSRWQSTAIVSVLFGLWHVAAEWNRTHTLALVGGVVFTALVSAFVFVPLRRRTDSVVAPIVVHAATNMSVLAAIWLLAH